MNSADIFHYVSSISVAVIAGFVGWTCYRVVKTLDNFDVTLMGITEFIDGIRSFRKGVKMGIVSLFSNAALMLRRKQVKGGERK